MDAQTLSLILGVAASKGDNVVASTRAAKVSAQAAADARDKVTAAELGEVYSYLGLGELTKGQASGSIATFSTDMAARLKSCKVSMNPVQDLHGYDSPWPAGGGANQANPSTVTAGYLSYYGEHNAQDSARKEYYTDYIPVDSGTNYTVGYNNYGDGEDPWVSVVWYTNDKTVIKRDANASQKMTWLSPDNAKYAIAQGRTYNHGTDGLYFIKGNDMPYSPYSNICPITGWTGVNVYRSGADTSNPDTYAVTIPNDPGTVYGGTLDVVTGVLTVDRAEVDLGTLTWNSNKINDNAGYRFYVSAGSWAEKVPRIPTDLSQKIGLVCSMFDEKLPSQYNQPVNGITIYTNATFQVYEKSMSAMTANEFKTDMSGVQLVYELATPITYTLTPVEIQTLIGQNNVWSDAGNVALTYWKRKE